MIAMTSTKKKYQIYHQVVKPITLKKYHSTSNRYVTIIYITK